MNNSFLAFDIIPSNIEKPIGVEVWFNDHMVVDYAQVVEKKHVICNFDDDTEQSHCVKIIVKNKTAEHTVVDTAGKIIQDSLLEIKNFNLEEIDIDKIVQEKAVYNHDFNGSGNQVSESFYGIAGCNGSIELKFTTPAYLWLLENM